jgi:collagenase-like PrtC family protease
MTRPAMAVANQTKLTLGPVLFNWAPETWRDFYFRIADEAPVDTVSIGEVVCSKRTPFFAPHSARVVERLKAAGKEVVHATLARHGAQRVCLPPEMPARVIAALAKTAEPELEVQVFGRLPLALSARCYHARSRNLHKDGCQFVCADDPDGMAVETLDGDPFVAVNGTQTLSHSWCNLVRDLA